jgi:hypothetical protein
MYYTNFVKFGAKKESSYSYKFLDSKLNLNTYIVPLRYSSSSMKNSWSLNTTTKSKCFSDTIRLIGFAWNKLKVSVYFRN